MIEDLLKAALLGIVQGLTEFLPVSSTGHLILSQKALGIDEERYGLSFDVALHLGTLIALLAYFGGRWRPLIEAGLRSLSTRSLADDDARLAWLIVLGTIPAAVTGLLFEDQIEDAFRSPALVATMLIAFSAVFVVAEAFGKRTRRIDALTWRDALVIGVAQAVALVPGVSRSGATISAGLLRDIDRGEAATFAFLMSAPIILGAVISQIPGVVMDFADGALGWSDAAFFIVGLTCAAIVGYASIAFLLRFLVTNSLIPFVYYRVALGLLVFAVLAVQAL
ncbi:MAG: undecaprenyl-diphosphatase UppP [Dehalococcoidia bacterium]